MSLDTFLAISPSEFSEIYAKWIEVKEAEAERERVKIQEAWEIARWTVWRTLCPPDKKELSVLDLREFSWDPKQPKAPKSTRERFEEMKKKYGQRL
jgi:hypothetical protein